MFQLFNAKHDGEDCSLTLLPSSSLYFSELCTFVSTEPDLKMTCKGDSGGPLFLPDEDNNK